MMDSKVLTLIDVTRPLIRFMSVIATDEQLSAIIPKEGVTGRHALERARRVVMDIKYEFTDEVLRSPMRNKIYAAFKNSRLYGLSVYASNPSRSQSSPWAKSDMWGRWHPLDALLAERRAILAGERAALEAAAGRDKAWWDEMRRG